MINTKLSEILKFIYAECLFIVRLLQEKFQWLIVDIGVTMVANKTPIPEKSVFLLRRNI